jgi:uncharacterized membrane protein
MSDVWNAGGSSDLASPAPVRKPTELFTPMFDDIKSHLGGYLLAGLGYFGAMFLSILALVLAFGLGAVPGAILDDETVLSIGITATGLLLYAPGLTLVVLVVVPLMNASLLRAVAARLDGDGTLGIGSAFSTFRQDARNVVVVHVLVQLVAFVGLLACYLPGLVALAALNFAAPLVVLHGMTPIAAMKLSVARFREHMGWHATFVLLTIVILFVVQYIPIVGILLLYPVLFCFQTLGFRAVFGKEPVASP